MGIAYTPEQAADITAIRQLALTYAVAIDSRDLDLVASLYVDDVDRGDYGRGHDALRRSLKVSLSASKVNIHNVSTHMITLIDADHATGTVYNRGEAMMADGTWRTNVGAYDDIYERRDGEWRFVKRTLRLFYSEGPLPSSGTERIGERLGGNAFSPTTSNETLPYAWGTWQRFQNEATQ